MAKKVKPVRVQRTAYSTKNQQDTTLRNNRATRKHEQAMSMRIGALEQRVAALENAAKTKPWRGRAYGSKKLVK